MDPWIAGEKNEFVDAVDYAMQSPLTEAFVRHVVSGQTETDADMRKGDDARGTSTTGEHQPFQCAETARRGLRFRLRKRSKVCRAFGKRADR